MDNQIKQVIRAIDDIFQKKASRISYMQISRFPTMILQRKKGDQLYGAVEGCIKKYVEGIREEVMKENDRMFLDLLLRRWSEHLTALSLCKDLLMYMDRQYVPSKKKKPTYEMGISLFGQQVFHKVCLDRILRLVLSMILQERNGELVSDKFQLRNICQMMLEISKKDIYETHFETAFLRESRNFFHAEAGYFFSHNTTIAYLEKVLQRLREERERANRCFSKDTLPKIEKVVKDEMIEAFKEQVITKEGTGCTTMLEHWKLGELKKVYDVLGLVPGALSPLVELVNNFCKEEGEGYTKKGARERKECLIMIDELIHLWEKYDNLLTVSFSKRGPSQDLIRDDEFAKSIGRAFTAIMNGHQGMSEFMSLYCDSKLRVGKTQIEESEFDNLFEQIIRLFRYLREKDIFEKYFKIHLGTRLLEKKSQSLEAERSFVSRLKTEVGHAFTKKIEKMFTDMRTNEDLGEEFKGHCLKHKFREGHGFDCSIMVLTAGSWPIDQREMFAVVPTFIQDGVKVFHDFYMSTREGRKLMWKWGMGSADVIANGFSRPYQLHCSTIQLLILNMFNKKKVLGFGDMVETTKVPAKMIMAHLKHLYTSKSKGARVLLKAKGPKTISNKTKFQANEKLSSSNTRLKVAPPVRVDPGLVRKELDEERKWQLDACIVRIMKMRKKLTHAKLVMEVTEQIQQRWIPSPVNIKKRILSLIEREYLERSKDDRNTYNYLA